MKMSVIADGRDWTYRAQLKGSSQVGRIFCLALSHV